MYNVRGNCSHWRTTNYYCLSVSVQMYFRKKSNPLTQILVHWLNPFFWHIVTVSLEPYLSFVQPLWAIIML